MFSWELFFSAFRTPAKDPKYNYVIEFNQLQFIFLWMLCILVGEERYNFCYSINQLNLKCFISTLFLHPGRQWFLGIKITSEAYPHLGL